MVRGSLTEVIRRTPNLRQLSVHTATVMTHKTPRFMLAFSHTVFEKDHYKIWRTIAHIAKVISKIPKNCSIDPNLISIAAMSTATYIF